MRAARWHPNRLTVSVVVAWLAVALLVWAQLFGAQRALILSQVVAFRVPTTIALFVGVVLFAVIACGKRSWGIAAGLAVVLGVAASSSGGAPPTFSP